MPADFFTRDAMVMQPVQIATDHPLSIAVIGSGISGLSAAWLLSRRHRVTLFEADGRIGGHSHTFDAGATPVDTGFIVYNEATYPNLTALFRHLDVPTKTSDMSFAVSLDDGRLEYSGTGLLGLFAQPRNLCSPRFWAMLRDLVRFYREAPDDIAAFGGLSLGEYLDAKEYGSAFRDDHLYPMAAAIWSSPAARMCDYPAAAFIRFCENHGLLKLTQRPLWRTVDGGSRAYIARLLSDFDGRIMLRHPVQAIRRDASGVEVVGPDGYRQKFDHAVIATHADQALRILADPTANERQLLGAFSYSSNEMLLHCDAALMPRRRKVWSSWNYASSGQGDDRPPSITYWMNRLQGISDETPLFVTLNPVKKPRPDSVMTRETYRHPIFDRNAMGAQKNLWSLQGVSNTWFCGSYFGAGFHEDGLQAGLAVGEMLGGLRRPWVVAGESARIHVGGRPAFAPAMEPIS